MRELLQRFQHKTILLFKLLLLQKRVLFFHSPVRPLSTSILALLALVPGLIESGLDAATCLSSQECQRKVDEVPIEEPASFSLPQAESSTSLSMKLSAWKEKLAGNWNQQSATQQQSTTSAVEIAETSDNGNSAINNKSSHDQSFEDLGSISASDVNTEVKLEFASTAIFKARSQLGPRFP